MHCIYEHANRGTESTYGYLMRNLHEREHCEYSVPQFKKHPTWPDRWQKKQESSADIFMQFPAEIGIQMK